MVATMIADATDDSLCAMIEAKEKQVCDSDGEPHTCCCESKKNVVGLVFPVYAWGLPKVVEAFIKDCLPAVAKKDAYVYAVMTCGDDMGYADKVLNKRLMAAVSHPLNAAFSVCMPNTYVCLPGMDVDSDELAAKKVQATRNRIPDIVATIKARKEAVEVKRGAMPWLKTYVIRPLFNKTLVTDKYLHHNDLCTGCGTCAKHCPMKNITMQPMGDKDAARPVWNHNCVGCLACYHVCPKHALHFGSMTKKKGQKAPLRDND